MKIEIENGYVELHESVKRRMSREYMNTLDEHAVVSETGDQKLTAKGVDIASEQLVRDMIVRVVVTGDDGVEKEVEATRDWMDDLAESDYTKIADYVLKKFNEARGKAKK